jgi:hypothetical protein
MDGERANKFMSNIIVIKTFIPLSHEKKIDNFCINEKYKEKIEFVYIIN